MTISFSKALFLLVLIFSSLAFAAEDIEIQSVPLQEMNYRSPLSPAEISSRTKEVLNYYKVPAEASSQNDFADLDARQNLGNLQKLQQIFDPSKMFPRLFDVTNSELKGFDDLDGKSQLDFTVNLDTLTHQTDDPRLTSLHARLAQRTALLPLKGLRVAIDPGHMGSKYYDEITGKFVRDNKGNYVSEGVIALQTSLLLKNDLMALGAEVMLTHETLDAVTSLPFENFPVEEYARNELLESIHQPWFQKLLIAGTGKTLTDAFDKSPERKKLFQSSARYNYFVLRADLWARSEKINAFNPDIALIIHYDTSDPAGDPQGINPSSPNQTKTFVAGDYKPEEFGSRKARKQFARHLLDQTQWDYSLDLGRKILSELHGQMGLNLAMNTGEGKLIEPGIFSRNLNIPRFLGATAVSYLECLFYNRPQEFYAFANTSHPMMIGGQNVPYSDRVAQVEASIKQGVINFTNAIP